MKNKVENKQNSKQLNILAVMQRFLVQSLIILACWHIITVWWQQDTDWYAGLMAFLWSGNMFWFNDYLKWFKNVA